MTLLPDGGHPRTGVIEAAGGLVWREVAGCRELAVIHRARHGDWTLPKGKVAPGEDWQAAALREVREETGCEVRPGSFAGSLGYVVEGRPKVVLFWHMEPTGGCDFRPSEEVDELRWMTVEEALGKLDHPLEAKLLRDAAGTAPADGEATGGPGTVPARASGGRRPWSFLRRGPGSGSLQRLASALASFSVELEQLAVLPVRQETGPRFPSWDVNARRLLARAEQAVGDGDGDLGWKCFHAAQRLELYGLAERCPEGLEARALALLNEGTAKLSGWRRDTVVGLLGDPDCTDRVELQRPVTPARLNAVYEAALVLHEHYANDYAKLRAYRGLIAQVAAFAALGVSGWLALATARSGPDLRLDLAPTRGVPDPDLTFAVFLFGLLGACFSALLSLFRASTRSRIPEQIRGGWTTLGRLAAGVIAALLAQALLASGMLPLDEKAVYPWILLVVAFAAGFSERLVVRAVEGLGGEKRE